MWPGFRCHRIDAYRNDRVAYLTAQLEGCDKRAAKELLESLEYNARHDEEVLADAWLALIKARFGDVADDFIRRVHEWHPRNPRITFRRAALHARDGEWQQALETIEGIDPSRIPESIHSHLRHLHGLALLHLGRRAAVRDVWRDGLRFDNGRCGLSEWLAILDMAENRPDEPDAMIVAIDSNTPAGFMTTILHTVAMVDRHLDAGHVERAREAMTHPWTWCSPDPQVLARLAAVYIRLDSVSAGQTFNRALALASFVHVMRGGTPRRGHIALVAPDLSWPDERLRQLAQRAERELVGGHPRCTRDVPL